MSHFQVLVIGDDVDGQLAPYHEFECTGHDDEYVQDIDKLPEIRADYAADPGEYTTMAEYAAGWYGLTPVLGAAPDLMGEHKYGWMRVTPDGDVTEAVERTNPNKRWDWYVVGGRYSDRLLLKNGQHADRARVGDIDLAALRAAAGSRAAAKYDRVHAVIAGRPVESWETVRAAHAGDIDAAREAYRAQPVVQDISDAGSTDDELRWVGFEDGGLGSYLVPREQYITVARDRAIVPFAVVRAGAWAARGDMGWFGCASNEKDRDAWDRGVNELVDGLPEGTMLTVVDCHI